MLRHVAHLLMLMMTLFRQTHRSLLLDKSDVGLRLHQVGGILSNVTIFLRLLPLLVGRHRSRRRLLVLVADMEQLTLSLGILVLAAQGDVLGVDELICCRFGLAQLNLLLDTLLLLTHLGDEFIRATNDFGVLLLESISISVDFWRRTAWKRLMSAMLVMLALQAFVIGSNWSMRFIGVCFLFAVGGFMSLNHWHDWYHFHRCFRGVEVVLE